MRTRGSASESQGEPSASNSTEIPSSNYEKITVKKLIEEIKSRNLLVKGISRLKKRQLIDN